ncbi:hypothetical protein [Desulfosediminicola flagellatus]|uniref:hypothetical protein n=1 Tax=Desulfosediminicola flagellatus TaxID=2569541 RepID=UPI0010AC5608|nr:hypothetical protein [Desulfosediminicola flagellatus]
MGIVLLGYIAALYLVEYYTDFNIPEGVHDIIVIAFSSVAIILFYVAWWLIKNPATYEAFITSKELSISYPESMSWSFTVKIEDIKRIEHRQTHSSGGKSIVKTGVLMENSDFHEISMNYGNSVNKMFKVLKSINPEITFPKTVKKTFYLFGKKIR